MKPQDDARNERWNRLLADDAAYRPTETLYCWIEDERVIHIKASGPSDGGLIITTTQARELSDVLLRFAARIE